MNRFESLAIGPVAPTPSPSPQGEGEPLNAGVSS